MFRLVSTAFCLAVLPSALLALNPHKTLAQYSHSVWTEAEGLPGDAVRALAQTSDGYLWIGTNEGLSRFDGYEFTTFGKDDGSLRSNAVGALEAGHDGTLWIGTAEGLTRYQNGRFRTFTTKDGLPDNYISAVREDRDQVLWIVAGPYLSRFENGKFVDYPAKQLLPLQTPRVLYKGPDRTLWVAGVGGVVKLVNGSFVPVFSAHQMDGRIVNAVVEDRSGRSWVGGSNGILMRSPDGKLTAFDAHDGLPDALVLALLEDRAGNLWAGTNNGLSRYEGGRFSSSDFAAGHNRNLVRGLFEDREGDLWVGTNSGLNQLRDDRFTVFSRTEGFPSDEPVAVHQSANGTIWIGYHNAGLVALEDKKIKLYTTKNGLASDEIFSIREKRNGDLLISSRAGLIVMHDGHFSNRVPPDPFGRTVAFDALEDRKGRIWVAGRGGVYQIANGEFRNIVRGGPVLNEAAIVLSEGLDGSVWAGIGGRGLWRITDGKTQHYSVADGLGNDSIRSLYQDADGTLWIGTIGGGLNAFRDGALTLYTVADGLLSNNISHIEDDGRGFLWLSTTRGICRVAKDQLRDFAAGRMRLLTPTNYGLADGLRSTQVAPGYPAGGGGAKTSDGRIWFPTNSGLAMFDPATEKEDPAQPLQVGFAEISVNGRSIDLRHPAELEPGPGNVQFRYSAIHLHSPERVRYEYKLEGLDSVWIPATTRRVADYSSLKHGQYRFLVRAVVPGQPPGEASFDLEVQPHFYERSVFLWLWLLTFVALIFGVYQLRLRQVRSRFSLVLDERARLAREIHDTMAQSFVGISSQLDAVAMRMQSDYKGAKQHLELAQKMARHSLTEAKRSVMDLRASVLEDRDLPSALATATNQWTAGREVSVEIEISGVFRQLPKDLEQNVLRIAQEAVTNAVKHARATRIWVSLRRELNELALTVRDDGCGFQPTGLGEGEGHFGLLGMRERAERHHGSLQVSSQPGQGTIVRMSIPLQPEESSQHHHRALHELLRIRPRSARS